MKEQEFPANLPYELSPTPIKLSLWQADNNGSIQSIVLFHKNLAFNY